MELLYQKIKSTIYLERKNHKILQLNNIIDV
jgi:hypothetical protein